MEAEQVGGQHGGDLEEAVFGGQEVGINVGIGSYGVSGCGSAHSDLRLATGTLSGANADCLFLIYPEGREVTENVTRIVRFRYPNRPLNVSLPKK